MTKRSPLDLLQKWRVSQYWTCQQPLLTRSGMFVLLRLLDRQNPKTGRCDPSAIGLCAETGLSERGVRGAFKELEKRGAIKRNQVSGRSRNQFLIYSVEEIGQNCAILEMKMRSGKRTGMQSAAAPPATHCRKNLKRAAPETIKETIKKKDRAEKAELDVSISGSEIGRLAPQPAPQIENPGEFERRVVKVFEREGHGYEGLLMLPPGKMEQVFDAYQEGEKTFGQSVGELLAACRAQKDRIGTIT